MPYLFLPSFLLLCSSISAQNDTIVIHAGDMIPDEVFIAGYPLSPKERNTPFGDAGILNASRQNLFFQTATDSSGYSGMVIFTEIKGRAQLSGNAIWESTSDEISCVFSNGCKTECVVRTFTEYHTTYQQDPPRTLDAINRLYYSHNGAHLDSIHCTVFDSNLNPELQSTIM